MPRITDRESRKREIVETYLGLVKRDGLAAVTTRSLAAELGVATGAMWTYFSGIDELITEVSIVIFDRTERRIGERTAALRGLPALFVTVEELLPLSEATADEALVLVDFWGRAASHPTLGASHARQERLRRERILQHLREAINDGDLRSSAPIDDLAGSLLAICVGMQVQHVVAGALPGASTMLGTACSPVTPWLTREHGAASVH